MINEQEKELADKDSRLVLVGSCSAAAVMLVLLIVSVRVRELGRRALDAESRMNVALETQ